MSLKLAARWMLSSSREAARTGASEVDIEHLYLGALAIGGAASRLLGRHGITLTSARRRVREALDADLGALGVQVPLPQARPLSAIVNANLKCTPRADVLANLGMKAPDTYALLVMLLKEETGMVRRLIHADGVVPQNLAPELKAGADDQYSPERVPVPNDALPLPAVAHRVRMFMPAPPEVVADVIADTETLGLWAYDPERSKVSEDGETVTQARGDKVMTLRLHVIRRQVGETLLVTWVQEMLDGRYAGEALLMDRFEITRAPGGSEVARVSGRRRFGLMGQLLAPLNDSMSGWGLTHGTAAIAFAVADRVE